MEYWKNAEEAVDFFVKYFEAIGKDSEIGEKMKTINQLVWFDHTKSGPECSCWLDTRGGNVLAGSGKPADEPELIMTFDADNAHLLWLGKLNPVLGMTQGKIKAKGPVTGLLKLAPLIKKTKVIYANLLEEQGKKDKIIQV